MLTEQKFILDARLQKDCLVMGKLPFCQLLLSKNAAVPWFILVPETTQTELYNLSSLEQQQLQTAINHISKFVMDSFDVTKLNVAAIGNIVSQMHLHVVGRHPADYCWPGVVWGVASESIYSEEQIAGIRKVLSEKLVGVFSPSGNKKTGA